MEKIDWVDRLNSCSLANIFEELKIEIQTDVEARNKMRIDHYYRFVAKNSTNRIIVSSESNLENKRVVIMLSDKNISATNSDDKKLFEATLTLNDKGECKFKIGEAELDSWHVRRRALEDLFFHSGF